MKKKKNIPLSKDQLDTHANAKLVSYAMSTLIIMKKLNIT